MPTPRHYAALLVCSALLTSAPVAWADSLRCGSALVSNGSSAEEILRKCGEPVSRQSRGWIRQADGWYGREVPSEYWTYGPRNGMYHQLRLDDGRLVEVRSSRAP